MGIQNGHSSDAIHNRNCHAYLLQLKDSINEFVISYFPTIASQLTQISELDEEYDEETAYGDLYSKVLMTLEEEIDKIYSTLNQIEQQHINELIYAIYHNDNHILENAHWINDINLSIRPQNAHHLKHKITEYLADEETTVNSLSPQKANTFLSRINVLRTFKPQNETNIPSIKHHAYIQDPTIQEYRFSTQAQRHHRQVRISPLFIHWLRIKAQKIPAQEIVHIYFNNLTIDTTNPLDIPANNEKSLSEALHRLEQDPTLKIAVITLPASKALMRTKDYQITNDKIPYTTAFEELLEVAVFENHPSQITDFRISPALRAKLWGSQEKQQEELRVLLQQSFTAMGIEEGSALSTAQKQAVWFHFIKFALTNHILTTLKPAGYNFSCKDAIDRGAASSLYYHFMSSFSSMNPMSQREFEKKLDVAAAMVKGRGLNFHRQIIWNVIDTYVNAHYEELRDNTQKNWLIFWRDMHCPHIRVNQLLTTRIAQCSILVDLLPEESSSLRVMALQLLQSIKEQHNQDVSGKRLLLEVVARTSQLLAPDIGQLDEVMGHIDTYRNLAKELEITNPALHIIAGIMKTLAGALLCLITVGYANSVIKEGIATTKAGFFAPERRKLCDEITAFSNELEPLLVPNQTLS